MKKNLLFLAGFTALVMMGCSRTGFITEHHVENATNQTCVVKYGLGNGYDSRTDKFYGKDSLILAPADEALIFSGHALPASTYSYITVFSETGDTIMHLSPVENKVWTITNASEHVNHYLYLSKEIYTLTIE